jgi:FKBP-type peptidyl-prolyl cis-trans isomerase SlyD
MAIQAEKNVVGIEYEVKEAGTTQVVDSNKGGKALEFIMGKSQVIPGLEKALVGMEEGESGDIHVKADEAYGERKDEAMQTLPREQFAGVDLVKDMTLYGQNDDGQSTQVIVKSFDDKEVTIDFNHPLAGKDLMFSIKVLSVRQTTVEELTSGAIGGPAEEGGSCGTGCGCH